MDDKRTCPRRLPFEPYTFLEGLGRTIFGTQNFRHRSSTKASNLASSSSAFGHA